HGLVTVIDWPLGGGQLAAYNHALRFFGSSADWLAYYDVDEFLVPLLDDDIPSFLARHSDAADVRVPRKEFGFSGHRSAPGGLAIDAYTDVADVLALDPDLPPRVKSIVQPAAISAVDVHLAFPADHPVPGAPTETAEVEVRGVAQLNHYYTRSFDEFEAKRFRGSATGRIARPAVPFDSPVLETDTAAQRFSERTSAMMERLRSLEAQPYYYGSELRIPFPRPNDLGRFAEFALANTAAGLGQPRRVAASRIKNLYAGVGLVGDLAGTRYQPARGALSGSVHTGVLVEHSPGRIERSLADNAEVGAYAATLGDLVLRPAAVPTLASEGGVAELLIDVNPGQMRRCYALGLMVGSVQDVRVEVTLERQDGSRAEPTTFELPASACVAGIVEIEPSPQRATGVNLRVSAPAPLRMEIYDLFLISYG
ncbi:MAG: glycosyltransferase family 92 protein, partial [Chloroflexota bacterium]